MTRRQITLLQAEHLIETADPATLSQRSKVNPIFTKRDTLEILAGACEDLRERGKPDRHKLDPFTTRNIVKDFGPLPEEPAQ